MPENHWFRPKTHGYGAAPTNWKGWAVIAVFMLATGLLTWLVLLRPALESGRTDPGLIVVWLVMVAALVTVMLLFGKSKTDGDWKWRWGGKE